jgi:ligand-binding sensor domain-containing protein
LSLLPWAAFSAQDKADANVFLIDTWQTPDGLPENLVDSILQTRDRYPWAGTYGGPARFDGKRFVTFGVHATYYLSDTTNLSTQLANWRVIATNVFDSNGHFSVTNAVKFGIPAQFYMLKLKP